MARIHRYIVCMETPDDDQTDPADMSDILSDVLNCRNGAPEDWRQGHTDTIPDQRAKFNVYLIVPSEKGDIA